MLRICESISSRLRRSAGSSQLTVTWSKKASTGSRSGHGCHGVLKILPFESASRPVVPAFADTLVKGALLALVEEFGVGLTCVPLAVLLFLDAEDIGGAADRR